MWSGWRDRQWAEHRPKLFQDLQTILLRPLGERFGTVEPRVSSLRSSMVRSHRHRPKPELRGTEELLQEDLSDERMIRDRELNFSAGKIWQAITMKPLRAFGLKSDRNLPHIMQRGQHSRTRRQEHADSFRQSRQQCLRYRANIEAVITHRNARLSTHDRLCPPQRLHRMISVGASRFPRTSEFLSTT